MSWKICDRVRETTTTAGTSALTLAGAASKFRTFASALAVGDTFFYGIQHQTAEQWEVGIGKLTAATTLSRDVVLASSNAGSAVNLSAGTKDVFLSASAAGENAEALQFFGDGSDGDVTISSSQSLSRDMYYKNLTIAAGGALNATGYRIFVQEKLDLSLAPVGAIRNDGGDGGAGSGSNGGVAGVAAIAATVGGSGAGTAGGAGATTAAGNGAASSAPANLSPANGGASGLSGSGGDGNGTGTFGAATNGATISNTLSVRRWTDLLARGTMLMNGGAGGPGGGGGGASSTPQAGGGGGGGAGGGGVVWISARVLLRGASTGAGAIRANGGLGGVGGAGTTGGSSGGGGGGSGGGGGWVFLAYLALGGASANNLLQASGGNGGAGGNGQSTGGQGGRGGSGGSGGRITTLNLGAGTTAEVVGAAGIAGGANSAATGGSGGTGNILQVTL